MAAGSVPISFDGYIRVSRVGGRSGDSYRSPSDQRAVIERLAQAHGLTLGEVVVEEDVSGSKKVTQRELGRLVEKVETGESAGLIVWKVSRFSRSLLDGVTTASRISAAGGRLLGEDLDTSAPMGKALLGLMLGLAEEELDARREGWKRAVDGAIARGIYIGATPVGYDKDEATQKLRQNADAPAVRAAFLARARGRSWNELASDLEAAGVKTATGNNDWHKNSVRTMIGNVVYKGTIHNGHEHHFPHLAIVTPAEWAAAQPSKGKGNRDHAPRGAWAVLGGLVRCDGCGHVMSPSAQTKDGRTYRYYKCQTRSCTAKALVDATKLDAFVSASALAFFTAACEQGVIVVGEDADVEEITELEQAIEDAKGRRRAAALALDPDDANDAAALEQLSAEVEAAKAALTEARGKSAVAITPAQWRENWDAWEVEVKRAQLRTIISGVRVARGAKITVSVEDMDQEFEGGLSTGLLGGVPFEYAYSGARGIKIDYHLKA